MGRPEEKKPPDRPRRGRDNNTKMDLREMCRDSGDWINPAQDRDQWLVYARTVMNLRVS